MEKLYVQLEREPLVSLSCSYMGGSWPETHEKTLIVCLNGIDNPHTMWYPVASLLFEQTRNRHPPMLMFDRPGQGTTKGRNPGVAGRPAGHGRDCLHAAQDIRELITKIADMRLRIPAHDIDSLQVIFVASSLGCAIGRIYAAQYPSTVAALLLLDSTLANSDTTSLFPDPHSTTFSEKDLPEGVTTELCVDARRRIAPVFDIRSPNKEGIWRGTLPDLLPYADSPILQGPKPGTPYVTVVSHDPDLFLVSMRKALGIADIMTTTYFSSAWKRYNEGLVHITSAGLGKGPVVAKGAGHLIHKDKPQFVVDELLELLEKLQKSETSRL